MTLSVGDTQTVFVPKGQVLTITVGSTAAAGTLTRVNDPGGTTSYSPYNIAGITFSVGPFTSNRNYAIAITAGSVTYAVADNDARTTDGSVPAAQAATVVSRETGDGNHVTVITLTNAPITMRDTEQGGGLEIYNFPQGRILIQGATGYIYPTTTSALASTLNAGVTCNWGVGTTTQASATVATTEQDLIPVTAFTSSATVNVAPAVSKGALAASAQFDGTTTAVKAFLNLAVAGATDIDGNATITVTGQITIVWAHLGDY